MIKIDTHTHILPKKLPEWSRKFGYGPFIRLQYISKHTANMWRGNQLFRTIEENCWNADLRIETYAKQNIQIQVICTIPVMFSYWAKPLDGLQVSSFLNDHIASIVNDHPKHYIGLGTLPMQDIDLAIQELERCKKNGLKGVQIGSNVNDDNLNEKRFFPFYEACNALKMAILVHPWEMMGMKNMSQYWLPWLVGMPAETTRALCSMIFGGVFEKFPTLHISFAHGGGSFLYTLGRIEHGFRCRPDLVAIDNDRNPKEYLGKFWIDSITHDPAMLQHAISLQGADHVMFGSDYPFPLGTLDFDKEIDALQIDNKDKESIFCKAAEEWLGIRTSEFK